MQLVFLFALTVHLSEAAIYLTIWKLINRHNKRMATAIGHQAAQKRYRKSAVSLVCEMYFYGVETITTFLLALATSYGSANTYNLVLLAWQFSFPVKNTIQALSTEQTRSIFLLSISKLFCRK